MATILVSLVVTAALQAHAASKSLQLKSADLVLGRSLAEGMLGEVMREPYVEPSGGGNTLGIDAGETAAVKTTFDDVDDFNGWSESPPRDPSGTALSGLSGWRREVAVRWSDPADLAASPAGPTALKRVTVTVYRNTRPVTTLTGVRSAD